MKHSTDWLNDVLLVQTVRGKEYTNENQERSFAQVAKAFTAITSKEITPAEVCLLLQILKDVRQWQNPTRLHEDSALDCISYAALKAEELSIEFSKGENKNEKEPI